MEERTRSLGRSKQGTHNPKIVGSNPTGSIVRAAPRTVGECSELEAFSAFHRAGYPVLISPFRTLRYDCAVEIDGRLLRVQVKTGRVVEGAVHFPCKSSSPYRDKTGNAYHGDADLFAVWVPTLGKCYVIPVNECGRAGVALRLTPAKNGQSKRVRLAADFELRPAELEGPAPLALVTAFIRPSAAAREEAP